MKLWRQLRKPSSEGFVAAWVITYLKKLLKKKTAGSPATVSLSGGARDEQLVQQAFSVLFLLTNFLQQIMQQQDEILDRFHSKVGVITDVAIGINEELDTHDEYVGLTPLWLYRILKGFHKDMDDTQSRLSANNKFVEKLLESTKGIVQIVSR